MALIVYYTGFTFDMSTCSCITEEASEASHLVTDERVERSDTNHRNEKKFGEMIIMVALAGIATVFFIIIVSLLHSIKTLRRSIRSNREDELCKSNGNICSEQSLLTTQNK
jgi:beta-lactamase regulating signal transducer with metallopeptidase domain